MDKKCPNPDCYQRYNSRKKPDKCQQCHAYIGGQTKSPNICASPKLNAIKKVYGLGDNMFSVYNHKQYRLICQTEPGKTPMCTFKTCMDGMQLCQKGLTQFRCRHIDLVLNTPPCAPEKIIAPEDIRKSLGDAQLEPEMLSDLEKMTSLASDGIVGYQLNQHVFIVRDERSTLAPLGWVHVYKSDLGKIECSLSSKCNRSKVKIRKKISVAMRCPHEVLIAALDPAPQETSAPFPPEGGSSSKAEVAVCSACKKSFNKDSGGKCKDCKDQVLYCSKRCQEEDWEQHRLDCGLSQKYLNKTAEYLHRNCKIPGTSSSSLSETTADSQK